MKDLISGFLQTKTPARFSLWWKTCSDSVVLTSVGSLFHHYGTRAAKKLDQISSLQATTHPAAGGFNQGNEVGRRSKVDFQAENILEWTDAVVEAEDDKWIDWTALTEKDGQILMLYMKNLQKSAREINLLCII